MTQVFEPTRLVIARHRRGLTRSALAKASGLSILTLTAEETKGTQPYHSTVERIAETLRFPVEFFYGPPIDELAPDGASFRALSNLSNRQKDQALAAGTLACVLSDWIGERFEIPDPAIPTYVGEDPEAAAMAVRALWGLGEQPIANMIHLLEAHGVRVFSVSDDVLALDAFSVWRNGTPYMFLNNMKSAERTRMDAAHELGHLVLHAKGGASGRPAENEAGAFAGAFLMPEGSVRSVAPWTGSLRQLIAVKRHWNVSVSALAYRMHKMGLSDWRYRMLCIEISRNGYRTDEPNPAPSESSQVLAKVFSTLRAHGQSLAQVAEGLRVFPDDLNALVFGLVLMPAPPRVQP